MGHLAKYKGQMVYVKRLKRQKIKVDRKLLKEMKTVRNKNNYYRSNYSNVLGSIPNQTNLMQE